MNPGLDNNEANDPRGTFSGRPAGQEDRERHLTPSEAPNNSPETGAGEGTTGFDSAPIATMTLGNKDLERLDNQQQGESSSGEVHGDAQPDVTANHKIPGNES